MAPRDGGVLPAFAGDVVPNAAKAERATCHAASLAGRRRLMVPSFITLILKGQRSKPRKRAKRIFKTLLPAPNASDLCYLKGSPDVEDQTGPTRCVPTRSFAPTGRITT